MKISFALFTSKTAVLLFYFHWLYMLVIILIAMSILRVAGILHAIIVLIYVDSRIMKDEKHPDEEYTPRNYVNAWLTDTLKSRLYGDDPHSDARPVRVQWDADMGMVRADIVTTSGNVRSELFNVPVERIDKGQFESMQFSLVVDGKRYRFVIANDQFTKQGDVYYNSSGRGGMVTYILSYALNKLAEPALDDLDILRRLLEAHNVKVVRMRMMRTILTGFSVAFIMLAILWIIAFVYVKSQGGEL